MNPIFSFRFDLTRENGLTDVLVLFQGADELQVASLSSEIDRQIDENLVPDEVIVLLQQSRIASAEMKFEADDTLKAVRGRLRDRARVTLFGYDKGGAISSKRQVFSAENSPFELPIDEFKRRAITHICRTHSVFVEATAAFHFENPSGRHTEHFIRLSNILVRAVEISFVAFCVLPHLPSQVRIAYLDTPALYAIVSAINDHFRSLDPARPALAADNFRSYLGVKNYSFRRRADAVVLVSASSSGGLAKEIAGVSRIPLDRIVHILSLEDGGPLISAVCVLKYHKAKNPEGYKYERSNFRQGDCKHCAEGSRAIKLQGDQFDVPGPQPEPLLIMKTDLPKSMEQILPRLVGKKIFAVGFGARQSTLPRQYYVDTTSLLKAKEFGKRLRYVVEHSVPANIRSVVYLDKASKPLAGRIVKHAKSAGLGAIKALHKDNLKQIPKATSGPVVIVAGVIESGRSLTDISRDLRSQCPDTPLHYIVGISKCTSDSRRESLEKTLVQCDAPIKHGFAAVENLLLPGSYESNAWHAEGEFLKRIIAEPKSPLSPQLKGFLLKRVKLLDTTSEPLFDALFLGNTQGAELKLRPGFVFWPNALPKQPHSQADVFFTISSVLQSLRAKASTLTEKQALRSNWFQQSLLAPANFGRYNDGIIQACLLRAAFPREINYSMSPEASTEMMRIVGRMLTSANSTRGEGAAEVLLAVASGRMSLAVEDLKILAEWKELPPVLQLFIWWIKNKLF